MGTTSRPWQVWGTRVISAGAVAADYARNFGTYEAAAEWCRAELAKPMVSMVSTWARLMVSHRHGSLREYLPSSDDPTRFVRAGYEGAGGYHRAEVVHPAPTTTAQEGEA